MSERNKRLPPLEFLVMGFEFHIGNRSLQKGHWYVYCTQRSYFLDLRLKLNSASIHPDVLFEAVTIKREHLTSPAMWRMNTVCETRFHV